MDITVRRALPPEITDAVIDFLHDTPAALYSSSLVQRSWRARAQRLIYAKIVLRDRQAYASLHRLLHHSRAFLTKQCRRTTRLEITDDPDHPYAHAFLLAFRNLFPALTALAFRGVRWGFLHPTPVLLECMASTFHSVTKLELHACAFRRFRDFARTVCALRSLRDLALVRTSLGRASLHASATLGTDLRLRCVRAGHLASDGSLAELLYWLLASPSAKARSIQVLEVDPRDLMSGASFHGPLQALLWQLGPSLTKLEIPLMPRGAHCPSS